MNFGKGGQNIVQASSGGSNVFKGFGGNILEAYLGTKLRRGERDYHRQKDEESRIRVNEATNISKVKSELLKSMVNPAAGAHGAAEAYRIAMEVHPEGHEKAGQFVNEDMANQVSRYGFDVGYRPAKTPASISQVAEWKKYRDSDPKIDSKTSDEDYSGTVARFGKDGKMTREKVSLEDIEFGEKTSQTPPASMTKVDDSSRPSNQNWSAQQKADLEKERPRTNNLNTGINEAKVPPTPKYSEKTIHNSNVVSAWANGKITAAEASDLTEPGELKDNYDKSANSFGGETDDEIYRAHNNAGLNDVKGTKY
jgi:hypothetical protein